MSKWTPGPWLVEPDGLDAFRIKSEDFGGVAYLHDPSAHEIGSIDEIAATARLIAAAPEMAELLDRLCAEFDAYASEGNGMTPPICKVREAWQTGFVARCLLGIMVTVSITVAATIAIVRV